VAPARRPAQALPAPLILQSQIRQSTGHMGGCERTFVAVVEWEWQRLGRFRGLVDGLVVAQVALVSDRDGADPGWIVYLTGRSQALDGRCQPSSTRWPPPRQRCFEELRI